MLLFKLPLRFQLVRLAKRTVVSSKLNNGVENNNIRFDLLTSPDSWERLRNIRIRVFEDSPQFIVGNVQAESSFSEEHWRGRIKNEFWCIAHDVINNHDIGVVGVAESGVVIDKKYMFGADCYMHSFWLEPQWRAATISHDLANFVHSICLEKGWRTKSVYIFKHNERSIKATTKIGFHPVGELRGPGGFAGICLQKDLLASKLESKIQNEQPRFSNHRHQK